jgi:hypothetical protein
MNNNLLALLAWAGAELGCASECNAITDAFKGACILNLTVE